MSDLLEWVTRLFADCLARSAFGVAWELDRAEPPLVASVMPADMPTERVTLDRDDVRGRIDFACRLQALLDVALDRPVPCCPTHGLGLVLAREGSEMTWTCREGDFRCAVGDYELSAFWPPTEADGWAAPLLAKRFEKFGVTGVSSFSVDGRDGHPVARVAVRPDADQQAVRDAAAPLPVELSHAPAITTVREWRPASDRQPAHEILTVRGVAMRLARLEGELRRAAPEDDCDFLVGSTRVRLAAAHLIGAPGSPLLQDSNGGPFADEGEWVSCAGGAALHGPVRGGTPIFSAGQISVFRGGAAAQRRAAAPRMRLTER
jgi:hypothetical protein